MAEIENLVLEHLRRMNIRLDDVARDIVEIKHRVGNIETGHTARFNAIDSVLAVHSLRLDRVDERLTRIERRLDLVEPH